MTFRFQLAVYDPEHRNERVITIDEYLERRAAGALAWAADAENCKLLLVAGGEVLLADRNMGSLEILMLQFEAARERLRDGYEAIVRSGIFDGLYLDYLLFEPAGGSEVLLSSFCIDEAGMDWALPVAGITLAPHELYDYVRENRQRLLSPSRLDRFGRRSFFENVPCPAAELLSALDREARLVRRLYQELGLPWEYALRQLGMPSLTCTCKTIINCSLFPSPGAFVVLRETDLERARTRFRSLAAQAHSAEEIERTERELFGSDAVLDMVICPACGRLYVFKPRGARDPLVSYRVEDGSPLGLRSPLVHGRSRPASPDLLATVDGHAQGIVALAFDPTDSPSSVLASGSLDGTIKIWSVSRRVGAKDPGASASGPEDEGVSVALERTLTGHANSVWAVAFQPRSHGDRSNGQLASASFDRTIKLWDLDPASDGTVATADTPFHDNSISTISGHTDVVYCISFSRDGRILASGSLDNTIKLWNVGGEALEERTITDHDSPVSALAFGPTKNDVHFLASGAHDGTVSLRQIDALGARAGPASTRRITSFRGHRFEVNGLAFSPDGRILASGSGDHRIHLWDVSGVSDTTGRGEEPRQVATLVHSGLVRTVAFSPDGRLLASGGRDETVRLWKAMTGTEVCTLTGHTQDVHSVAFSPNGHVVASASMDGTIRFWRIAGDR